MSRCGIKTLVVDKRSADVRGGQADGIQARTLEMLDSFGLADTVWNESCHMGEVCYEPPCRWLQLDELTFVIQMCLWVRMIPESSSPLRFL